MNADVNHSKDTTSWAVAYKVLHDRLNFRNLPSGMIQRINEMETFDYLDLDLFYFLLPKDDAKILWYTLVNHIKK